MKVDRYRIDSVTFNARIIGFEDRFADGFLPKLEAALNAQEVFETRSSTPRRYLSLEGEHWDIEVEPNVFRLKARGFMDCTGLQEGVSFFLGQLREVAEEEGDAHIHLWALAVGGTADWFIDPTLLKGKTIGQRIGTRALKLKPVQLAHLPGDVMGSGIELAVATEAFFYTLDAGPVGLEQVRVAVSLHFPEPEVSQWPKNDIDAAVTNIERMYDLVENDVKAFIDSVML